MSTETNTALTAEELALYLGCEVVSIHDDQPELKSALNPNRGHLIGVIRGKEYGCIVRTAYGKEKWKPEIVKLVLRPLIAMKDEELDEFEKLTMFHNCTKDEMADEIMGRCTPQTLTFALSRSLDVFNWIGQGKAISKP